MVAFLPSLSEEQAMCHAPRPRCSARRTALSLEEDTAFRLSEPQKPPARQPRLNR